jgi:putative inorganic carbon (hco3(-)) transporter
VERMVSTREMLSAAATPGARRLYIQILVAAGVGALLGLHVLLAMGLSPTLRYLALAAAIVPFALMVAGSIRRVLLAIIILDIPLQMGIHLGYREDVASLGSIGGFGISATTLALLGLYAIWIADALANRRGAEQPVLRWSFPLALYVGAVLISATAAYDAQLSAAETLLAVQTLLLFVYVASNVRTRRDVLFVVTMLLVALALEALLILATGLTGREIDLGIVRAGSDSSSGLGRSLSRAVGTFGSPNVAAAYLAMIVPLAVAILMSRSREAPRRLAAVATFLGVMALLITFSRGGWLAFSIALVALLLLLWRRGWLSPAVPVGIAVVVVLPALFYQEAILRRLMSEEEALGRVPLLTIAVRMFESSPVVGIGPNNFALVMDYFISPEIANAWIYTVHNKYLLVLSETGVLGLAAFLLFLGATLFHGWKAWRSSDRVIAVVALGLTAAVAGHTVHMMVEIFNHRPMVQLLWMVAALLMAMARIGGADDVKRNP